MSRFDDVRAIVRSLGGVYKNADRVVGDAIACLQNVPFLEPKALQMTRNDGSTSTLLALDGTIQTYYGGASYQTPVCIYIPEPYPDYPPIAYLRPTREMFVVPGHRFADANGLVYLPYLSEWRPLYSNIVELIGVMVSVFSEMPPLRSRPPEMGLGPAVGPAQNPYPVVAAHGGMGPGSGIAPGPIGALNGPQMNAFGIPLPGGGGGGGGVVGPGPGSRTMPQYPPVGSMGPAAQLPAGPGSGPFAAGRLPPPQQQQQPQQQGLPQGGMPFGSGAATSSSPSAAVNADAAASATAAAAAAAAQNGKRPQPPAATPTPKDEKAEKVREITAYLQSKLADMLRSTGRHMDITTTAQEQLENRGSKGKALLTEMKKSTSEVDQYGSALDRQIAETRQWLDKNEKIQLGHVRAQSSSAAITPGGAASPSSSPLDHSLSSPDSSSSPAPASAPPHSLAFEDVPVASSKLQQQLLELVAEDSAIEDSYFFLEQLLSDGKIELKTMLVEARELSRKQFRARYLARKIDALLAADRKAKLGATSGGNAAAPATSPLSSAAGGTALRGPPPRPQEQPYYPSVR